MESLQQEIDSIVRKALDEKLATTVKPEYANSVEISNANSKGEIHITVKGKSDGNLEELVKEVVKQFNEARA